MWGSGAGETGLRLGSARVAPVLFDVGAESPCPAGCFFFMLHACSSSCWQHASLPCRTLAHPPSPRPQPFPAFSPKRTNPHAHKPGPAGSGSFGSFGSSSGSSAAGRQQQGAPSRGGLGGQGGLAAAARSCSRHLAADLGGSASPTATTSGNQQEALAPVQSTGEAVAWGGKTRGC